MTGLNDGDCMSGPPRRPASNEGITGNVVDMRAEHQTFTLTAHHVALLRRMVVCWNRNNLWEAPAISQARPYGNIDVEWDVAEIIGENLGYPQDDEDSPLLTPDQRARMLALHRETGTALQIVLSTGSFEPGVYRSREFGLEWERI